MRKAELQELLDNSVSKYNRMGFIEMDPISIPHRFHRKQDIEIAAFLAATLAWGRRQTIINKVNQLMTWMDEAPYDFILHHSEKDRKLFEGFKHRTFNGTDILYFLDYLQLFYQEEDSLETAFMVDNDFPGMKTSLEAFHEQFFMADYAPHRTRKHISTPAKKSACKRLNMFLRWMVRKDEGQVDFGIWNRIPMSSLMMPLDVHVARVGHHLGLLKRRQRDWTAVEELTNNLRKFDKNDPVKYDFALFGLGVEGIL